MIKRLSEWNDVEYRFGMIGLLTNAILDWLLGIVIEATFILFMDVNKQ